MYIYVLVFRHALKRNAKACAMQWEGYKEISGCGFVGKAYMEL